MRGSQALALVALATVSVVLGGACGSQNGLEETRLELAATTIELDQAKLDLAAAMQRVEKLEAGLSAATELVEAVQEALQSGLSLVTQSVTKLDLIEWLEAFQRWLDAAREDLYTGEA